MNTRVTMIDEDDFQAFVDGQLPPERCRTVMAYLAANPEESERMSEYHRLSEDLHRLYDEVLYEPLPKRLRVETYRKNRSLAERVRGWFDLESSSLMPQLAGLAGLMVASGLTGWWLNDHYWPAEPMDTPAISFARQAAQAHLLYAPDLRHPVEFGADQEDSLLTWLSERLGQPVHAPNLQEIGFVLVGGRLLPAAELAAAQLMYEGPEARRITLYLRQGWNGPVTGPAEGTVSYFGEGGLSMVYWTEGPLAYALIGELDREQLFATAKAIQQQIEKPTVTTPASSDQTADKDAT